MTLTRDVHGPAHVPKSLRDIAREAQIGKDAVGRALKVLGELGLVMEAKPEKTRAVSRSRWRM